MSTTEKRQNCCTSAWILAAWLWAPSALAEAPSLAPRSEVPIREIILSDGTRRFGVSLKIGETSVEAGLDSGSSGLRVLPGVLGPGDAQRSGGEDSYNYAAGTELRGIVGKGQLTVGAAAGPLTIQLVSRVDCVAWEPKCPSSRIPETQFGIQGNGIPGEGFKAIFGVNMADADVDTPLKAIGVGRWIIELPRPGDARPGRLILNPTDDETDGYVKLPVLDAFREKKGGLHDAVTGCVIDEATKRKVCGALLMDTGAPGITIQNGGGDGRSWSPGPATLAFYDGRGRLRATEDFITDQRSHASHLTFDYSKPNAPGPVLFTGLTPYFAFSVLYDTEHQFIGLKPRTQVQGGPIGSIVPNP